MIISSRVSDSGTGLPSPLRSPKRVDPLELLDGLRLQLHVVGVVRDHGVTVPCQQPANVRILDPLPDGISRQGPAEDGADNLFINPSVNSVNRARRGCGGRAPAKLNTSSGGNDWVRTSDLALMKRPLYR